ncbi:P-type conjugative transfer protein TrbL [Hahella ganghwensis]|uniref:P-type conjugative transfer protein TrbL n=1 Tax=Hahella ganghwensis TaxID=286420 RepID=UPI00035FCC12|nr:P-type conjugative transfer protein TrbL [Hahella ganghwensis]
MNKVAKFKSAVPIILLLALILSMPAHAAIDNSGLLDSVLARYNAAAATWAGVITNAASWLFWTLVMISMVWTFGMLALKRADIGDFFAEFVRFIIFTGFFWWALTNGPNFASSIYQSLKQLAGNATGLGGGLSPSGIVDVGFAIFDKVLDQSDIWSPVDSFAGITIALIILIILALVGINMLLLLCSAWILAYGGVFFLGFGGSRWTHDIAINYYKTVLGVAAQLMAMVLLVGIGKTFLDDYYTHMSAGISLKEMGVLLIVAVILLVLVNKVPALLSGVVSGASVGGAGIGTMGAGAALGAMGVATAAAAVGGAAAAAGAANAAGGGQAIMAAISKARENVEAGTDVMSGLGSALQQSMASSGSTTAANDGTTTPFAEAAGIGSGGGGSIKAAASKAGRIMADTGANLAKGAGSVAKAKADGMKGAAMGRIAETTGGKIATAIKGMGSDSGDSIGSTGMDSGSGSEGSGSEGSGWINQTGGFSSLSPEDQEKASESHAEWQESNPERNTFDVEDYVSYVQEHQQQRNSEIAGFVNKNR